jgi:maltose O-acetyltransferase
MMKMNSFWRLTMKWAFLFIPDGPSGDRMRGKLYQPFLKEYGDNFKVATAAFIFNPNGLSVGHHVYIGFGTYLGQGDITLDNQVLIGNFASITASNHLRKDGSYRFGGYEAKEVCIGRGTWLAAHSSVMAGVKVGEGCVVAAGAVVTKDFGDHLVIVGVPAKTIKENSDYEDR